MILQETKSKFLDKMSLPPVPENCRVTQGNDVIIQEDARVNIRKEILQQTGEEEEEGNSNLEKEASCGAKLECCHHRLQIFGVGNLYRKHPVQTLMSLFLAVTRASSTHYVAHFVTKVAVNHYKIIDTTGHLTQLN